MKKNSTLLKYICLLFFIVLISSLGVRFLTRGESLTDYAEKNPDVAYEPVSEADESTTGIGESDSDTSGQNHKTSGSSSDTNGQDRETSGSNPNDEKKHHAVGEQAANTDGQNLKPTGDGQNATLSCNSDQTDSSDHPNSKGDDTSLKQGTGNTTANDTSYTGNSDSTTTGDTSNNGNSDSTTTGNVSNTPESGSNPAANDSRIIYQEGFYYEEIPDNVAERITGISYKENPNITLKDLRYMKVLYHDFSSDTQEGELICNQAIAQDLVEIFYELYQNDYQIEKIALVDEYDGDDTLSMEANNTSCFNYRVVDGTTRLSKHALGLAIDINPYYNPYIVYNKNGTGETYISPKGSEIYADRSQNFPYKIDSEDLCYRLFKEHGFTWGGDWNSTKDYQHFQKAIN